MYCLRFERVLQLKPLKLFSLTEEDGVPYESLRPTYTHEALVKLMEMGHLKYVISQNGDGLHGLSGIPDEKISELHGNVFIEKCEKCGKRYDRPYYVMDDVGSQYYEELEDYGKTDVKKPKFAVQCEKCGLSHRTGRKCSEKVKEDFIYRHLHMPKEIFISGNIYFAEIIS